MIVLPSSFDGAHFELVIGLDETGLQRVMEYDPAVVEMSALPHEWLGMALDHYHVALLRGGTMTFAFAHPPGPIGAIGQMQPGCLFAFSINAPGATVNAPPTVFSILDDACIAQLRAGQQILVPWRDVAPPGDAQNPRDLVVCYATPGDMEIVDYHLDHGDAAQAARQVTRGFAWRPDLGDPTR